LTMNQQLSIGFSPCPNDTFIFYALVHGLIARSDFRLAPPQLEDVETLNYWALEKRLDITKLSFHAFGHVQKNYQLLSAGAALGRGCGPLLIRRKHFNGKLDNAMIAIPGEYTTAALLLKLFAPQAQRIKVLRFDEIIPALLAGEVDAGVIIHESRFTYQQFDLHLMEDLGQWWEEDTGFPIPLGGIAARKELGDTVISSIEKAIAASVQWAFTHPLQTLPYIRAHAQELNDTVIQQHIKLYVNDLSEDIGEKGRDAITHLLERSAAFLR